MMRGAFLIRLARNTKPAAGRFEGRVEEVDSGKELRFRSSEELLQFLGGCFDQLGVFAESESEACDMPRFQPGE